MGIGRFLVDDDRRWDKARIAVIVLFAAAIAAAGLFTMPPLDRDEARFAQASAQMLETGDFVTIRFQDKERNKKPAGVYWLQAASVSLFSSVEAREIWAYRLPSAVGVILAALFTYLAGARAFGPATGFLGALLLASAPAVAGEATIAKTDAALLAAICAAQAAFLRIFLDAEAGKRSGRAVAAGFWTAIGAGVLLKGPIILIVVGLTALALFARRARFDWISAARPLLGVLILMLMIAPWALAINAATEGRFFAQAVGGDMLAKIGGAQEGHSGPPGYYLALLAPLFWPASALLLPAARRSFAARKDSAVYFLLAWIAPSWLAFEITATKLPHYTLPLYPAIALLAAHVAMKSARSSTLTPNRIGALLYAAIGLGFAATLIGLPLYFGENALAPAIAAFAIAALTLVVAALFWKGRHLVGALGAAALSAALAFALLGGVLPGLQKLALSPRLDQAIDAAGLHARKDGAPPTALAGYYEPSAIFLLGTETATGDGRRAAQLLAAADRAVVVESREESAFRSEATAHNLVIALVDEISGFNYSNGDDVVLRVYRRVGGATLSGSDD